MARRLNGTSQYFNLPVVGTWRSESYNWYIGGFVHFVTIQAAPYIADFGNTGSSATGGTGRYRLLYDNANTRILASSSKFDGSGYRQNTIEGFTPNTSDWYYIGYRAMPDSDVVGQLGTTKGTLNSGAAVTGIWSDICQTLRFGARAHNTVSGYANVDLAAWIWCSNSIPTDAQIAELAAGKKPAQVSGLTYHHHWAFDQTGDEPSLVSAATLTAVNSPTVVDGPSFGSASPLPIIII